LAELETLAGPIQDEFDIVAPNRVFRDTLPGNAIILRKKDIQEQPLGDRVAYGREYVSANGTTIYISASSREELATADKRLMDGTPPSARSGSDPIPQTP
jgi:hypothetical protein